jgi:DNA-binding NarL/FixJ family response regulator
MWRRKDLTEAEKATIIKEIAKGKTTKSIAERINRHVVTVSNKIFAKSFKEETSFWSRR